MKLFPKYVAQFVYGAFDGTVTTFAVVAAGAGAGLSSKVVVILALANLTADGFSMGASAYLSHQAERRERKKKTAAHLPFSMALATFLAFLVVGAVPALPYFFDVFTAARLPIQDLFIVSCIATALAFIWLGHAKGRAAKTSVVGSIIETFVLGIVAASLAYFVGAVLQNVFGI